MFCKSLEKAPAQLQGLFYLLIPVGCATQKKLTDAEIFIARRKNKLTALNEMLGGQVFIATNFVMLRPEVVPGLFIWPSPCNHALAFRRNIK